ncbi:unnamed protein product [Prunus armeniaca]|uniref:Uncharacterized protein n=1 Tax=Prunus armeniaca TaxID=36596 RepID=A0A6J5WSN7_PRUAR|nr:unnamed protein product [Prunus armeniaca]
MIHEWISEGFNVRSAYDCLANTLQWVLPIKMLLQPRVDMQLAMIGNRRSIKNFIVNVMSCFNTRMAIKFFSSRKQDIAGLKREQKAGLKREHRIEKTIKFSIKLMKEMYLTKLHEMH